MNEKQEEEILDKIRERVLEREQEISKLQDKEANVQATLQALEEITEVPRHEMERIADEIRASYEKTDDSRTKNLPVPSQPRNKLPATVGEALAKLPPVLREEFMEEYQLQRRKVGISYFLWLIPPPLSCHYFYIRRPFTQILYSLTAGGFLIWWLVDLFRIPALVQEDNRKSAKRILKRLFRHTLARKHKEKRRRKQLDF